MIYDKIKIYVTKRIATLLESDADSFEFHKRDGVTVNKNAFLTALIINYQDEFRTRQQNISSKIEEILKTSRLTYNEISNFVPLITEGVNREITYDPVEKFDSLVSLKPTKESQPIIEFAENYLINGSSLSEFYRNMFTSYASQPKDKREEIIFRKQVTEINKAISENKKIFITTQTSNNELKELEPYAIARSKEEMHLYLLAKQGHIKMPLRISRITSVTILNTESYFTKEDVEFFKKMQTYGPQFFYGKQDPIITVRLTPNGKEKFKRFYVHRPIPISVNDNVYVFNCSQDQVIQYFIKFGNDAFVESPIFVRDKMMMFFRRALQSYKRKIFNSEVAVTEDEQ